MIYQMADTAMNPRADRGHHHRPPAEFLFRAERQKPNRSVIQELLDEIGNSRRVSVKDRLSGRAFRRAKNKTFCIARALAPSPS